METVLAEIDFYGVLGRITAQADRVDLRFYPFAFPVDPDSRAVFEVRFEAARFDPQSLEALKNDEIEVTVLPDHVEVLAVLSETTRKLEAAEVTARWTDCDEADLLAHIRQLNDLTDRLHRDLSREIARTRRGEALVVELKRRAEIKAAASDELRVGQAAALSVLDRMLTHFRSEDHG